jgi:dienelactone hydrolase
MKTLLSLALASLCANVLNAAIKTETIEYKQGETTLEGALVYDDAMKGPRPGVLVAHQWKGLSDYERKRAVMLAELGYAAFCVDIYGKGIRPPTPQAAGAEAGKYKGNRALLRERVNAGLLAFRKQSVVEPKRLAAIGYCFGGTTVIELARSGAEVTGVVSFHGALDSPKPEDGKNIRCKVLALHGADDPFVPAKDIEAFESEMRSANADWQLVKYGGAVHSFTDWNADGSMAGAKYDEKADKRSWEEMKRFFAEVLK